MIYHLGDFKFNYNFSFDLILASLRNGTCHTHLQDKFAPLVIRYVDLMESSIAQSVHNGFEKESWAPVGWAFDFADIRVVWYVF